MGSVIYGASVATVALLEVLDKLPDVGRLWGFAAVSGAIGFAVCRIWSRPAVAAPRLPDVPGGR